MAVASMNLLVSKVINKEVKHKFEEMSVEMEVEERNKLPSWIRNLKDSDLIHKYLTFKRSALHVQDARASSKEKLEFWYYKLKSGLFLGINNNGSIYEGELQNG